MSGLGIRWMVQSKMRRPGSLSRRSSASVSIRNSGWTKPVVALMPASLLSVLYQGSGDRRPLAVELGRLLEGVADPHHHCLVERLAGDLKGERQSVFEADGDR